MFDKWFAHQLRNPSGLIGKYLVSRWMNRSNAAIYRRALELTSPGRLLEIGFGGGGLLDLAVRCGPFSKVSGVDASVDMVRLASSKLRAHIERGKLDVRIGDLADLPFAPCSFDGVISLNTIYFWPSLETGLSECVRVLADKGVLVLGFDDKAEMSQWPGHRHGFSMYDVGEVHAALVDSGFTDVEVATGKTSDWGLFHFVRGIKL